MAFDEIPDQQSPGEPPRQIGRYELLEPIGRGGMSEVFRARDTVLGQFVAIEMIATDLELAEETRERSSFGEARSQASSLIATSSRSTISAKTTVAHSS